MKIKNFLSTLILLSTVATVQANASFSCNRAITQTKNENDAIRNRNWTIDHSIPKLRADEAILEGLLIEKKKIDHTLEIYKSSKGLILQSQKVVAQVLSYMRETIVKNESLKISLEQLRGKFSPVEGVPLADQLRALLQDPRLKRATADLITQLANAIELLESSTSEWQDAEKELLQRYLEGETLAEVLYDSVLQLTERLANGLDQQTKAEAIDQAHADDVNRQISASQDRIAAYKKNIAELQKANVISAGRLAEVQGTYRVCTDTGRLHPHFRERN